MNWLRLVVTLIMLLSMPLSALAGDRCTQEAQALNAVMAQQRAMSLKIMAADERSLARRPQLNLDAQAQVKQFGTLRGGHARMTDTQAAVAAIQSHATKELAPLVAERANLQATSDRLAVNQGSAHDAFITCLKRNGL